MKVTAKIKRNNQVAYGNSTSLQHLFIFWVFLKGKQIGIIDRISPIARLSLAGVFAPNFNWLLGPSAFFSSKLCILQDSTFITN